MSEFQLTNISSPKTVTVRMYQHRLSEDGFSYLTESLCHHDLNTELCFHSPCANSCLSNLWHVIPMYLPLWSHRSARWCGSIWDATCVNFKLKDKHLHMIHSGDLEPFWGNTTCQLWNRDLDPSTKFTFSNYHVLIFVFQNRWQDAPFASRSDSTPQNLCWDMPASKPTTQNKTTCEWLCQAGDIALCSLSLALRAGWVIAVWLISVP